MILLVGASVRALMESAAYSGYEVTGIDFFGDIDSSWRGKAISLARDYKLPANVINLLGVAQELENNGLVYAAGPENHPDALSYWDVQGKLLGNPPTVLKMVRNPWLLQESLARIPMLEKVQVRMPRFYRVSQWQQLDQTVDWLLKPLNRGGGHGIIRFPNSQLNADSLANPMNCQQNIIQERIEGTAASVTFLANGKESMLLGDSYQLTDPDSYRYEGNIVPLDSKQFFDPEIYRRQITAAIEQLTLNFGLKGINTLDIVINSHGIWVLELNPRWSASVELIERHLGKWLFKAHLAALKETSLPTDIVASCPNIPIQRDEEKQNYWGKRIVYAKQDFRVLTKTHDELMGLYIKGVRDIPQAGTLIEKEQPICTILASGNTQEDCRQSLQAKAKWAREIVWGKDNELKIREDE